MIIKLFASIREKIGQDQIIIENESLKNIDDVINYFWKNFNIDIGNCMFACNLEYINKDFEIEPNQEISIIPPVSGGSDNDLVEITQNQEDIAKNCNLIIMTTPSKEPLLQSIDKNKGIHITAIGSDTHDKQELNTSIFKDADIVATDSLEQCKHRGEIPHAVRDKFLDYKTIIELGAIIKTGNKYRKNEDQITIADLTGMAVQDIQIAKAVCQTLKI